MVTILPLLFGFSYPSISYKFLETVCFHNIVVPPFPIFDVIFDNNQCGVIVFTYAQ